MTGPIIPMTASTCTAPMVIIAHSPSSFLKPSALGMRNMPIPRSCSLRTPRGFHPLKKNTEISCRRSREMGARFGKMVPLPARKQTAINRQNQQNALLAEMLLTGLHAQGKIKEDFRQEFMDIWHLIMLYDEHTWGRTTPLPIRNSRRSKSSSATRHSSPTKPSNAWNRFSRKHVD